MEKEKRMTIEDWNELCGILKNCFKESILPNRDLRIGKNKDIRKKAGYDLDIQIMVALNWIKKWNESYNLLVGEEDNNGLGQQAIIDNFKKPEWFKNDLEEYLEKVENKIKDLDNS